MRPEMGTEKPGRMWGKGVERERRCATATPPRGRERASEGQGIMGWRQTPPRKRYAPGLRGGVARFAVPVAVDHPRGVSVHVAMLARVLVRCQRARYHPRIAPSLHTTYTDRTVAKQWRC